MKKVDWVKIRGKLKFDPIPLTEKQKDQGSWKKTAIIQFDCDLAEYYSWFISRRYNIKLLIPQRGTHMTIINDREANTSEWNRIKKLFNGKSIDIYYNVDPRGTSDYWWLKCNSPAADEIRTLLDLGDPFYSYHITIGTLKNSAQINQDHNKYILDSIKFYGEENSVDSTL